MQIFGYLAALGLTATLAGLTLVSLQSPTDQALLRLQESQVRQRIRLGQMQALQLQQTTTLAWALDDTHTQWTQRSFYGPDFVAFADGSVSPGEILLCRNQQGRRLVISQLGRLRAEPVRC